MGILDTQTGRDIMQNIVGTWLAQRRMSRRLHRSFYIAFKKWQSGEAFSLDTLLNDLNTTDQAEILKLNELLVQWGFTTIGAPFNGGIYHVDSVNGSDETGDGTDGNPYASLAFMASSFPKVLDYKTTIKVSGSVAIDEMILHQEIGPEGSLSIVGGDDPTVVTTSQGAGPFTITGVTQTGTPVACNDIAVAETFAVNELYGKWLLFQDGPCQGQAIPIHSNTASNLFTRGGLDGTPAIGNTFLVVTPTTTITCPKWDIEVKGGVFGTTELQSRFNLYNLTIDIQSATYKRGNFRIKNDADSQIAFVTLKASSDQFSNLIIESNLNNSPAYDVGAQYSATTDVTNLQKPTTGENAGLLVWREGFPPATYGFDEVIVRHADDIHSIDCAGRLTVHESIGSLNTFAAGVVRFENGASGGVYIGFISGNSAGAAIWLYHGGSVKAQVNYLQAGQDAFQVDQGMLTVSGNNHGTFTGYGFRFSQGLGYVVTTEDPTSWAGTTGAIYFAGGVGTTAFPAADARVTDAIANFFARIETA